MLQSKFGSQKLLKLKKKIKKRFKKLDIKINNYKILNI